MAEISTAAMGRPAERRVKKVLVVAYYFPPVGEVGIHRTLRFAKWLPAFGWEPIVLTTRNGKVQHLDQSLLDKVPKGVEVHRTHSWELLNYGTSIDGARPRRIPAPISRVCCELPRDLWRLLAVPDEKLGWVPYAVREGRRLISARGIDAIYVSGKPFSSYHIGHRLGRQFGIPWIMDLRDLWTLNRRNRPRNAVVSWLERRQERRFVQSAAAVVANTPDNRSDFVAAYPQCDPRKFVAITNGYDRDDYDGLPEERYEKFTIAYAGRFYSPRQAESNFYRRLLGLDKRKVDLLESYSPRFFFQALANLLARRPELRDRIQVVMSGGGCEKARPMVAAFGLTENVKLLGWVSYRESMEMVKRAHAHLLVLSRGAESKGWIPSKLFQYLGSGNPIIAMAPDGDVKDIIVQSSAGIVVGPDDVAGVERAIFCLYQRYCGAAVGFGPRWDVVEQYEAKHLTGRLAECLDHVVGRSPSSGGC